MMPEDAVHLARAGITRQYAATGYEPRVAIITREQMNDLLNHPRAAEVYLRSADLPRKEQVCARLIGVDEVIVAESRTPAVNPFVIVDLR